MGIALSTIGIITSYCVETNAGTRPSAGYIKLPDIKGIPAIDAAPGTEDSTTFDNLEYTSYIETLKDLGGSLELTANFTQDLYDKWATLCSAYETGIASNKKTWMCFDIPGFNKSAYLPIKPSKMGIPEASANGLLEATLHVTPVGEPVFEADPSYAGSV